MAGKLMALLAVWLFAMSTPLTKQFVGMTLPMGVTLCVNLGIGLGLLLVAAFQVTRGEHSFLKWDWHRADWGWFILTVILGSLAAPLLSTHAFQLLPAANVSLFSSFEGIFTVAVACLVFREKIDRWVFWGVTLITLGCCTLFAASISQHELLLGSTLSILAYLGWSLDTNVIAKIAHRNLLQMMSLKCLTAALILFILSTTQHWELNLTLQEGGIIAGVGFVGYGLSYLLFLAAIRKIGPARSGSFMSLSPFFGVAFSLIYYHEQLQSSFWLAAALVACGVILLFLNPTMTQTPPEAEQLPEY